MEVDAQSIRERYESLPSDELRRIVDAMAGEYTPEAHTVAREILARRSPEPASTPGEAPRSAGRPKSETWAMLGAMAAAGHISRIVFRAVRMAQQHPDVVGQIARDLAASPWTYLLAAGGLAYLWKRRAS
jgi:hypothetical protein